MREIHGVADAQRHNGDTEVLVIDEPSEVRLRIGDLSARLPPAQARFIAAALVASAARVDGGSA